MNSPKVSIIVPVYNVEKYLRCCMDSLLNQTLKDIEIILVDDESPDHCHTMCDEYAKQDHRVKVVHKKNGGLGFARNSGLEIAAGEFVAFVDSDDYVELNTYQKLYALATDTKADVVYFTFRRFNDQGVVLGKSKIKKELLFNNEAEVRGFMLDMIANSPEVKSNRDIEVSSCCALYRNELIKKYELRFKSERELISEDLLFNMDYLLLSSNVMTVPDTFYNYRWNPSSLSKTFRADRVTKYHFFYQYLLEILNINNLGMDGYLRATRWFIEHVRNDIRRYIQSSLTKKEKIQRLKEVANHHIWREIAASFPYKKLPCKQALQFYLLQNRYCHLLYYLEVFKKIVSPN